MYKLPELPYSYDALEPYIDAKTMEIHHSKHHAGYVKKLNSALENFPEFQDKRLEDLLKNLNSIPEEIRTAIKNNGGGHFNHSFFWEIMGPNSGGEAVGDVSEAIKRDFNSFDDFRKMFSEKASGIFGSGWAWLVVDSGRLKIVSTANQDSPLSNGLMPILGLDVWEHAYYLKYQNRRADYIQAWWNVVNWNKVDENFKNIIK